MGTTNRPARPQADMPRPERQQAAIPRPEHPRPDFRRAQWMNLNGEWEFDFHGTEHFGEDERFLARKAFTRRITVPFAYQSRLSGIGTERFYPCVWYRRAFDLPDAWTGGTVLLHFGAVDYEAAVWLNGAFLGTHRGGYIPFSFDAGRAVKPSGNELIVKVVDSLDRGQPRGKQSWCAPGVGCWYTQVTGIWQTVWLEHVPRRRVEQLSVTPDPEAGAVEVTVFLSEPPEAGRVRAAASLQGVPVAEAEAAACYPATRLRLAVKDPRPWEPGSPVLYDLSVSLEADGEKDEVESYFGMRRIEVRAGRIFLNGKPLYQRLVLDQGYWPDGLYTAPDDEAIKRDILSAMEMGFNGCRKHMKVEDPRFLYWADTLGFLVWDEMPGTYDFTPGSRETLLLEWMEVIRRDAGHPCVITWLVFNESWGVRNIARDPAMQEWVRRVYEATKAADPTRPVIDNDGWEHVRTDILGYHDYSSTAREIGDNHKRMRGEEGVPPLREGSIFHGRTMMAGGLPPCRVPVMVTEFGGIAFAADGVLEGSWGYDGIPRTPEEFKARFRMTVEAVRALPGCAGMVYTQLTDVENEINGLLTADRRPKFDPSWIRSIISGESAYELEG